MHARCIDSKAQSIAATFKLAHYPLVKWVDAILQAVAVEAAMTLGVRECPPISCSWGAGLRFIAQQRDLCGDRRT
jgi:hypothetical protein